MLLYLVHLVVSFAAGALVIGIIAVIVARTSEGDRTFLDMRGLPVFTGVAVSVAVFAVFRGSAGTGRGARAAAIFGMLALVAAGVYLYRPELLIDARTPAERVAGLWSEADEQSATEFRQEIVTFKGQVDRYQQVVASIIRAEITPDEFRGVTAGTERALEDALDGMEGAAGGATNEDLGDALTALADTYDAQLGALKAVSSGLVRGDFTALKRADTAFKDARAASERRFRERVQPLLARAGFDVGAFRRAVATA